MTYHEILTAYDHGVTQAYGKNTQNYAEVLSLISTKDICVRIFGEHKWYKVPLDWVVGIENGVFIVNSQMKEVERLTDIKPQFLPEPKPVIELMGQLKLF